MGLKNKLDEWDKEYFTPIVDTAEGVIIDIGTKIIINPLLSKGNCYWNSVNRKNW